jgi:hypothetical protein
MRCPKGILVSILSPLSLFVLMKIHGLGFAALASIYRDQERQSP